MATRRRCLPQGWYPDTAGGVRLAVESYLEHTTPPATPGVAGVAPHAGWTYSGAIAAMVVRALEFTAQTVVVVGGHLGRGDSPLAAREDTYETPLGPLEADLELLEAIEETVPLEDDTRPDNTVEVQLPLVRCLLPRARALALRAPPCPASFDLGAAVERAARALGRSVTVLGSTDLTHYGPAYGHTPRGLGQESVRWVREVSDARLVACLAALDPSGTLRAAAEDRSACSAGAALVAMGFARARGVQEGRLLHYATSLDAAESTRFESESFVGYAGVLYALEIERARSTVSRANARAEPSSAGVSG